MKNNLKSTCILVILCFIGIWFFSCKNKQNGVTQLFGPISFKVRDNYILKKQKNNSTNSHISWWLVSYPDSFNINYYDLEKINGIDTIEYGYGTNTSMSLYDILYEELPPKNLNNEKFSITFPVICANKARLILTERKERVMSDSSEGIKLIEGKTKYAFELSFKDLCNKKNTLSISAQNTSEETKNEMVEAIKTISISCNTQ